MATCGDCMFLVAKQSGEEFECVGKRCGLVKVTPQTDASACLRFVKKKGK